MARISNRTESTSFSHEFPTQFLWSDNFPILWIDIFDGISRKPFIASNVSTLIFLADNKWFVAWIEWILKRQFGNNERLRACVDHKRDLIRLVFIACFMVFVGIVFCSVYWISTIISMQLNKIRQNGKKNVRVNCIQKKCVTTPCTSKKQVIGKWQSCTISFITIDTNQSNWNSFTISFSCNFLCFSRTNSHHRSIDFKLIPIFPAYFSRHCCYMSKVLFLNFNYSIIHWVDQ